MCASAFARGGCARQDMPRLAQAGTTPRTRKPTWLSVANMMRSVSPSGGRCSCSRSASLDQGLWVWVGRIGGGGGLETTTTSEG